MKQVYFAAAALAEAYIFGVEGLKVHDGTLHVMYSEGESLVRDDVSHALKVRGIDMPVATFIKVDRPSDEFTQKSVANIALHTTSAADEESKMSVSALIGLLLQVEERYPDAYISRVDESSEYEMYADEPTHVIELDFSVKEWETEGQMLAREQRQRDWEKQSMRMQEAREKELLEKLKAKYE